MRSHCNGDDENIISFAGLSLKLDSADQADKIVSALASKSSATCLDLSGNTLGIDAAQSIGTALQNNKLLEKCLFNDLFTGRSKNEIAPALKNLTSGLMISKAKLVELDLSDNAFGPNGVVGVTDLLASETCSNLEILRMNNQGLGHEGCRYLVDALLRAQKSNGKNVMLIKSFSAGRNRLENVGAQLLANVFASMGSLEELSLYQNGIGIHGIDGVLSLTKIMKNNPNLRVLNLSDNSLTPAGGKILAQTLPFLTHLEELYLSDCILRSSGTVAIASVWGDSDVTPNLRVLNMTGNEIKRSAGVSLILSLASKSKLESLDLNANEFGRNGVQCIIRTLESVGLLHALPKPITEDEKEETTDDNSYLWAFDDDQGSDNEDDEEETDYVDDVLDEEAGKESVTENEEDEEDSSYEKIQQSSFASDQAPAEQFSFRETLFSLQQNTEPNSNDMCGLFSALRTNNNTNDSVDAAVVRSKLWANNANDKNSTIFGNLFGTPKLADLTTKQSNPFPPPALDTDKLDWLAARMDENKLSLLLKEALQVPKSELAVNNLVEFLCKCGSAISQPPLHPLLCSIAQSVNPENLVRLTYFLSLKHKPSSSDPITQTIVGLLASVFIDPTAVNQTTTVDPINVNQAVNCVLIYMNAVKVEKYSEDWSILRNCATKSQTAFAQNVLNYSEFIKILIQLFGPQLLPHVVNCLTTLLTAANDQDNVTNEFGNWPDQFTKSLNKVREDMIQLIECRIANIKL